MQKHTLSLALESFQRHMTVLKKYIMEQERHLHSGELAMLRVVHKQTAKYDKGPTLVVVSHLLGVSKATITIETNRLIKKGLLVKNPCPEDHRSKELYLTQKGEYYLTENRQRQMEILTAIEEALGEEDTGHLLRILDKVNAYFDEIES